MDFTDPPQVSRPLYPDIAESVIETLDREIRARLPADQTENLSQHLNYLAMSICRVMQQNDPPDFDEQQRSQRAQKVMRMVEQYLSLWYMG